MRKNKTKPDPAMAKRILSEFKNKIKMTCKLLP